MFRAVRFCDKQKKPNRVFEPTDMDCHVHLYIVDSLLSKVLASSKKVSTLKGNNMLSLEANSFFLEIFFRRD